MEQVKLTMGDSGERSAELNTMLHGMGYPVPSNHKVFDGRTKAGVMAFQNDYRLRVTGIIDSHSWSVLKGLYSEPEHIEHIEAIPETKSIPQEQTKAIEEVRTEPEIVPHIPAEKNVIVESEFVPLPDIEEILDEYMEQKEKDGVPSSHEGVRRDALYLQKALHELGLYSGAIDGLFGLATDRSVRRFQEMHGLLVDGVVGQKTWEMIERNYNDEQQP